MSKDSAGRWVARLLLALAAFGASFAAVTFASAHGGDVSKIHSCVNSSSGTIKIVGANDTCKNNEAALDWSQNGAPGPAGPQGPIGPQGPQGPQGPSGGIAGIHEVFELGILSSDAEQHVEVLCPDGETAISGGYNLGITTPNPPVAIQLFLSIKDGSGTPIGWQVTAREVAPYNDDWRPVVTALCVPGS